MPKLNKREGCKGLAERILFIPDPHFHHEHLDAIAFLRRLKERYRPTHIVFAGDLFDHHADSYHEQDPDLPSSGDEFRLARARIKPLFRLFPKAHVLESNHGALPDRKAKTARLSKEFIRSEKERIGAPAGWHWHRELVIQTPRGPVMFIHGARGTQNLALYSLKRGISMAQGHYHSKFEVSYWNNGRTQGFAMTAGCLINDESPAFEYNANDVIRPILGAALILDGVPLLIPMQINRRTGRWTGRL